jgi:hypothetical protein
LQIPSKERFAKLNTLVTICKALGLEAQGSLLRSMRHLVDVQGEAGSAEAHKEN